MKGSVQLLAKIHGRKSRIIVVLIRIVARLLRNESLHWIGQSSGAPETEMHQSKWISGELLQESSRRLGRMRFNVRLDVDRQVAAGGLGLGPVAAGFPESSVGRVGSVRE